MNRRVLIPLVVALVVLACVAGYVFVIAVPDYRTTVLVDSSAPGKGLTEVADAVTALASNSGDADELSLRRFGGECGNPGNTEEIANDPDEIAQAVGGLAPSGKATLVDGVVAAIDGFSGFLTPRGSVRNRIIVVSTSGLDACSDNPAAARKTIDDRLAEEGLDLDIRVVGFQIPEDGQEALAQVVGADSTEFADSAADLAIVLDELVVPDSPEAAPINAPEPEPEPTYAFTTSISLGVVRGNEVIGEAAPDVDSDYAIYGSPGYTADGNFAFVVTVEGIAVVDAESGADRIVPCGQCVEVVSTSDSVISWLAGNVMTTLDLADAAAQPQAGATILPDRQVDEFSRVLPLQALASKDGNTLVTAPDGVSAYGGGNENLYLVGSGGDARPVGLAQGNVAISRATFSPDGRTVAYVAAGHAGACEERSSVVVLDLASGTHTGTPTAGDPNVDGASVRALWYDEDGALNMIYNSWRCTESGGSPTAVAPDGHWRLAGSGWAQQEPGYVRDVAPGFRAVLGEPAPDTFGSELYSEIDGVRTKVADNARAIAVPESR